MAGADVHFQMPVSFPVKPGVQELWGKGTFFFLHENVDSVQTFVFTLSPLSKHYYPGEIKDAATEVGQEGRKEGRE